MLLERENLVYYIMILIEKKAAQRRYQATKPYPTRAGEGLERDEYPYASTYEGGTGAEVAYVPRSENSRQGGDLRRVYSGLNQGDAFLVLPVPKDEEPDVVRQPIRVPTTVPFPLPIPRLAPSLVPLLDGIMRVLTPIFDPSLFNNIDKYNPDRGRINTES